MRSAYDGNAEVALGEYGSAAADPYVAGRAVWAAGLLVALALAVASPLASRHPDGLMWVARQQGFFEAARAPLYTLIPGYVFPGLSNSASATIIAGVLGSVIVFGVALGVGFARRRRQSPDRK